MPLTLLKRRKALILDRRHHNICKFLFCLGTYDWTSLLHSGDIQYIYTEFICRVHHAINTCMPHKIISIGPRDPVNYITPFVTLLLKQRCRLLRTDQLGRANDVAVRKNSIINVHRRSRLNNMKYIIIILDHHFVHHRENCGLQLSLQEGIVVN